MNHPGKIARSVLALSLLASASAACYKSQGGTFPGQLPPAGAATQQPADRNFLPYVAKADEPAAPTPMPAPTELPPLVGPAALSEGDFASLCAQYGLDKVTSGICYGESRMYGSDVYVTMANLTDPTIRLVVTPQDSFGMTVPDFAQRFGADVAVNGNFHDRGTQLPYGIDVSDGNAYQADDSALCQTPGFYVLKEEAARKAGLPLFVMSTTPYVDGQKEGQRVPGLGDFPAEMDEYGRLCGLGAGDLDEGMGAGNGLVFEGRVHPNVVDKSDPNGPRADAGYYNRNPRTALGLNEAGNVLYMVVVDGRSARSAGVTMEDLGNVMISYGAWEAVLQDGGGSSTMYEGGAVRNVPSDGSPRLVANHIGVDDTDENP